MILNEVTKAIINTAKTKKKPDENMYINVQTTR